MVVTWVTLNEINDSVVEYGTQIPLNKRVTGSVSVFQDGGTEKRREYIHRVVLHSLKPGEKYCNIILFLTSTEHVWTIFLLIDYHCGSDTYGWSPLFWFTPMHDDADSLVRMAVYGDMGRDNAHSLVRLQQETEQNHFDLILHVGK